MMRRLRLSTIDDFASQLLAFHERNVANETIHVPGSSEQDQEVYWRRDHGSAYVRVDGNLNKGSMGTDVFLWFRPNMPRSTEVDQPARRYIKWSSDKRQAMCEEALKRAVRQQCSNSERVKVKG